MCACTVCACTVLGCLHRAPAVRMPALCLGCLHYAPATKRTKQHSAVRTWNATSNCSHGSVSFPGHALWAATSEYAPGTPWYAVFEPSMDAAPCVCTSSMCWCVHAHIRGGCARHSVRHRQQQQQPRTSACLIAEAVVRAAGLLMVARAGRGAAWLFQPGAGLGPAAEVPCWAWLGARGRATGLCNADGAGAGAGGAGAL